MKYIVQVDETSIDQGDIDHEPDEWDDDWEGLEPDPAELEQLDDWELGEDEDDEDFELDEEDLWREIDDEE